MIEPSPEISLSPIDITSTWLSVDFSWRFFLVSSLLREGFAFFWDFFPFFAMPRGRTTRARDSLQPETEKCQNGWVKLALVPILKSKYSKATESSGFAKPAGHFSAPTYSQLCVTAEPERPRPSGCLVKGDSAAGNVLGNNTTGWAKINFGRRNTWDNCYFGTRNMA